LIQRDATFTEVFTLALLRSLARMDATGDLEVEVTVDFRAGDQGFKRTVGALTRVCHLPGEMMKEEDLLLNAQKLRPLMRAHGEGGLLSSPQRQRPGRRRPAVLLNFEYCIAEAWLGGDAWVAKGFVPSRSRLNGNYGLEIAPVLSQDTIEVFLMDEPGTEAARIAEGLMNHSLYSLKSSIQIILNYFMAGLARYSSPKRQ
jgi:hypothetical protein